MLHTTDNALLEVDDPRWLFSSNLDDPTLMACTLMKIKPPPGKSVSKLFLAITIYMTRTSHQSGTTEVLSSPTTKRQLSGSPCSARKSDASYQPATRGAHLRIWKLLASRGVKKRHQLLRQLLTLLRKFPAAFILARLDTLESNSQLELQ